MKKFCIGFAMVLGLCSVSFAAENAVVTDARDNQKYHVVKIGDQQWLAENIRFNGEDSFAPNGDEKNVAGMGRLYTWKMAMKACPEGWRLPNDTHFQNLMKTVCGSEKGGAHCAEKLAQKGFKSPLPGRFFKGNYNYFGSYAHYWSSTQVNSGAFSLSFNKTDASMVREGNLQFAYSVRCIKK